MNLYLPMNTVEGVIVGLRDTEWSTALAILVSGFVELSYLIMDKQNT